MTINNIPRRHECPVKRGLQQLSQRLAQLYREEWGPLLASTSAQSRPELEMFGQRLENRLVAAALDSLDELQALRRTGDE
jgi:hypothetical protein